LPAPWRVIPIKVKETVRDESSGWKYLEVWLALENASQEWRTFPDSSFRAEDIYLTTAEGYRYPLEGSWGWSYPDTSASNWMGTGAATIAPGFRVRGLTDAQGLERSLKVNHLLFKVAQGSTRYEVHIANCDPIALDRDITEVGFPDDKPDGQFQLGAPILVRGKGTVHPKSCQLITSEVWPSQVHVLISITNASGGYDQTLQLTSWVVGDDGILHPESARTRQDGAEVSTESVTVGPGQTLEMDSTFYVARSVNSLKLLMKGDVEAVYALNCEQIAGSTVAGFAASIPWLPEGDDYGGCTWYYSFDVAQPPFDNPLVRQAFALALDREALSELASHTRPATTFVPYRILGRDLYGSVGLPYGTDEARSRLAQAGYRDGQGFPATTLLVPGNPANPPAPVDVAAAQMWRDALGVSITIEEVQPFTDFLYRIGSEGGKVWRSGWCADYNDPDNFLSVFKSWGSENRCWFASAAFDSLVAQARASADNPLYRQGLYVEAERILCEEEAAIIPMYQTK